MNTYQIHNAEELEFTIFCIENIAIHLKKDPKEIYKTFTESSNILHNYIIPNYDILHTQSKEYIIEDITNLMKEKGLKI